MEALSRLDRAIGAGAKLTPATVTLGEWVHPAWHMSDFAVRPLVEVETREGRLALVAHTLLGAYDLFLISNRTPGNRASWTRPRLLPIRWDAGARDLSATLDDDRQLRITFTRGPARRSSVMDVTPDPVSPETGQVTQLIDLPAIERDNDDDGWTDLEEARLGLLPNDRDTDKDGVADGEDSCPNLAPADETETGDAAEILRRALFAVFAVGGSRHLLLVEEGTPRVSWRGYSGPVLYGVNREAWLARNGSGGVFVKWRILQQAANEAVVEIVDWEGMLAAGGQNVWLQKRDGRWRVIARETTWVS